MLRLQGQGTPSVAYPFDGVAIRWMATFSRLTHVRALAGSYVYPDSSSPIPDRKARYSPCRVTTSFLGCGLSRCSP